MMKMMTVRREPVCHKIVTMTLCIEELFLGTQYLCIALPVYQMVNNVGEGYGQSTQSH
jgi:hypothetical protein